MGLLFFAAFDFDALLALARAVRSFTPPNPATGTVIGTANLSVNTCNSITLTITTNAASNGLPNVTQQLQPIGGPSANCPYTTAFTACSCSARNRLASPPSGACTL